ncbi:hypothetical protein ACRRTK_002700 [Alexandromys fortis]
MFSSLAFWLPKMREAGNQGFLKIISSKEEEPFFFFLSWADLGPKGTENLLKNTSQIPGQVL